MKKILFTFATLVLAFSGLLIVLNVHADENQGNRNDDTDSGRIFNPNNQLSKEACGKHLDDPVIDVTQKVQNDADSGVAGDFWAFDYYTRHITVWQTVTPVENEKGTYCAIVTYNGHFYTVPGQIGPGNIPVGALINTPTDQPVNGPMSGGRRATIIGTLLTTPLWPTHGFVGTTNYQCDIHDNCPGVISWPGQYFNTGFNYVDVWWGWQYLGGSHGSWINAISGNSGNIL